MAGPDRLIEGDTICAPATAPGEGAVGIVRLSGPDAVALADRHFRASSGKALATVPSHTVHHGHVIDSQGGVVDEVLAVVMRGPRSYTAEDVVEFQCHGGGSAVDAVLGQLLAAGCRMAGPGEFTRRAFLNGRIDLTQAESVLEVIHARTALHHRLAQRQLTGALSEQLQSITELLRNLAAHTEAAIDFPDDDLELPDDTASRVEQALNTLNAIIDQGRTGQLVREGVQLAILGRPNVGKSSLLNRLLGYDRAIVADLAGTTRDVVEAELAIDGIRFMIQDTAGIRTPGDAIEAQGVARSRVAAAGADVILLVLDGSTPLRDDDRTLLADHPNALVVLNKQDLGQAPLAAADLQRLHTRPIAVSATTGTGIEQLKQQLLLQVRGNSAVPLGHAFLINQRQQQALGHARDFLEKAHQGLTRNCYADLVAADLRSALDAIGTVTGETTADDLLDRIFSEFCIGK